MEDASDHRARTNLHQTNFALCSTEFERFAENDFRRLIQIRDAMHGVRIFERTTIVLGIVLRTIVAREHQPIPASFLAKTIIDAVDHADRE